MSAVEVVEFTSILLVWSLAGEEEGEGRKREREREVGLFGVLVSWRRRE